MKYLHKFTQLTFFILFSLVYGINPPQVGQFPSGFWEQMEQRDNEPDISVSPDSLSEELYVGDSATQVLTISNNGDVDLDWEIYLGSGSQVLRINRDTVIYVFEYTGSEDYFEVPEGVGEIFIETWGAQGWSGSNLGGSGGYASGSISVNQGDILYIYVGQEGEDSPGNSEYSSPSFNGGGDGFSWNLSNAGGAGGGASDVRMFGNNLEDRIIVAGGGGGSTNNTNCWGGDGGGLIGGDASDIYGPVSGGTQDSGGIGGANGSFGQGGNASDDQSLEGWVGGGGGGWFGGAAGYTHGPGSGGSSYVDGVQNGYTQSGVREGNGLVYIHTIQSDFELDWLSVSPESGSTVPGEDNTVNVSFNAVDLEVGSYFADILITSNDPDEPSIEIPVHLDVDMLFPDIAVSPDSLSEELIVGETSTQTLTIYNDGDADLDWSLGGPDDSLGLCNVGNDVYLEDERMAGANFLLGSMFTLEEAGSIEYLSVIGGPSADSSAAQGQLALYSDDGTRDAANLVASTAIFDLVTGDNQHPVESSGWLEAGDYWILGIYNDTGYIGGIDTGNVVQYVEHTFGTDLPTELDVTEYCCRTFNYYMSVTCTSRDEEWLSTDLASGTIAPGSSQDVVVTFDATDMEAGDYSTDLSIASNDPDEPLINIPVELVVFEPVGWIEGHVTNDNGNPISGAELIAWNNENWADAVTDDEGHYWMEVPPGYYEMTAHAEAHYSEWADVEVNLFETSYVDFMLVYGGSATISDISDVPGDQGGWVYISFARSIFDTDSLNNRTEMYTVERLDGETWVGLSSVSAYGNDVYVVEVHTLADSTSEGDAVMTYRIIAAMDEGNFASDPASGYSVDNIAPNAPSDVTADVSEGVVYLDWTESDAYDLDHYAVYRSTDPEFVPGEENRIGTSEESEFSDDVEDLGDYYYAVTALDIHENESDPSELVNVTLLSLEDIYGLPEVFTLHQNYPNPFNPETRIRYDLPEDAMVNITIYDMVGRIVKNLVSHQQTAGYRSIQWNATNNAGQPVSAGLYLYTIQAEEFRQVKKMILLK